MALLSAAILGFEISLLRILLVASWYHFAFVVISISLLGFGASGTFLSILRSWLLRRAGAAFFVLTFATAVAIPACTGLAQDVPVEARFVPILLWSQVGQWTLYWVLLSIPFLLGASAVGLALMAAGDGIGRVYAANLAGSGIGAIAAPVLMSLVPPEVLPLPWGALVLVAAASAARGRPGVRWGALAGSILLLGAGIGRHPIHVRVDPYKYGAYVERLVRQGSAQRLAFACGPRGVVEAYGGEAFHEIPFLSGTVTPPAICALLVDGHHVGSLLRVRDSADAAVVDGTLMAFPCALAPPAPRVLLLGERSGLDVWLSVRHGAAKIEVVQADVNIFDLLRGPLNDLGGGVLDLPGVETVAMDPRHFVERGGEEFDLIRIVSLESSAAGSGGVAGLGQDYLVTVQGLEACLRLLSPRGILSVSRGIQTPPRDNLKLLATLVEALRRLGADRPGGHFVIVRDYLAVCTTVKMTPWSDDEVALVRKSIAERELTPVWFPGVKDEELNRPDEMPGPEGEPWDWYHQAAWKLFSPEADDFIRGWPFDIRPPTDDRPFFMDFCKLGSIAQLREAFGDLWLTRAEVAFLFVLAATGIIGVLGCLLTVAPLVCLRRVRKERGKTATAAYFAAIGFGYLLFEMVLLSKLSLLAGDPVEGASVTISALLVSSGVGSLAARRVRSRRIPWMLIAVAAVGIVEILVIEALAGALGSVPLTIRLLVAAALTAPAGLLMGIPMPAALTRLHGGAALLVPWAWGVNGFASVLAAPTATMIAMTWGFHCVAAAALLLYLAAAWLYGRLPEPSMAGMEYRSGSWSAP